MKREAKDNSSWRRRHERAIWQTTERSCSRVECRSRRRDVNSIVSAHRSHAAEYIRYSGSGLLHATAAGYCP